MGDSVNPTRAMGLRLLVATVWWVIQLTRLVVERGRLRMGLRLSLGAAWGMGDSVNTASGGGGALEWVRGCL